MEANTNQKLTKEEIKNCEGLNYLTWDMFDSPDRPGSGYDFMEREPVIILDEVVKRTRRFLNIERGYLSKAVADRMNLASNNPHRVGRAIQIRVVGQKKRMDIIKHLCLLGVTRIAVGKDILYFDTDGLKNDAFMIW
jgi:hypothetical protein